MASWRPANIKGLPKEAAHTINQLLRETNQRIDNVEKNTPVTPIVRGVATLNFGTIPANSTVTRTINKVGVNSGGVAAANPVLPLDSAGKLIHSARTSGVGQITVLVSNPTTSPIACNTVAWNHATIL